MNIDLYWLTMLCLLTKFDNSCETYLESPNEYLKKLKNRLAVNTNQLDESSRNYNAVYHNGNLKSNAIDKENDNYLIENMDQRIELQNANINEKKEECKRNNILDSIKNKIIKIFGGTSNDKKTYSMNNFLWDKKEMDQENYDYCNNKQTSANLPLIYKSNGEGTSLLAPTGTNQFNSIGNHQQTFPPNNALNDPQFLGFGYPKKVKYVNSLSNIPLESQRYEPLFNSKYFKSENSKYINRNDDFLKHNIYPLSKTNYNYNSDPNMAFGTNLKMSLTDKVNDGFVSRKMPVEQFLEHQNYDMDCQQFSKPINSQEFLKKQIENVHQEINEDPISVLSVKSPNKKTMYIKKQKIFPNIKRKRHSEKMSTIKIPSYGVILDDENGYTSVPYPLSKPTDFHFKTSNYKGPKKYPREGKFKNRVISHNNSPYYLINHNHGSDKKFTQNNLMSLDDYESGFEGKLKEIFEKYYSVKSSAKNIL